MQRRGDSQTYSRPGQRVKASWQRRSGYLAPSNSAQHPLRLASSGTSPGPYPVIIGTTAPLGERKPNHIPFASTVPAVSTTRTACRIPPWWLPVQNQETTTAFPSANRSFNTSGDLPVRRFNVSFAPDLVAEPCQDVLLHRRLSWRPHWECPWSHGARVYHPSNPQPLRMAIKDVRLIEAVEADMPVAAPDEPEVFDLESITPASDRSVPVQPRGSRTVTLQLPLG